MVRRIPHDELSFLRAVAMTTPDLFDIHSDRVTVCDAVLERLKDEVQKLKRGVAVVSVVADPGEGSVTIKCSARSADKELERALAMDDDDPFKADLLHTLSTFDASRELPVVVACLLPNPFTFMQLQAVPWAA